MKQKNRYQELMESVCVPEGLNERVLWAAGKQMEIGRFRRSRKKMAVKAAVCAVCALALVLGTIQRQPAVPEENGEATEIIRHGDSGQFLPSLSLSFGLTAYAASTGNVYSAQEDGGIAFAMGEGMANPSEGDFTGCLFQITGEEIESLFISVDQGGLYRYRILENLTEEEMAEYRQAMAEGRMATAAISMTDDGVWYMPEMVTLGECIQEAYDPEVRYGFWVSPEEMSYGTGMGMEQEARADVDVFDGAALTITATFTNGEERTQVYRLRTGSLKVERIGEYELTVLPELAEENDPYVYGIYARPEG